MECDEGNYEDTYSTWSPHFLFRFSKKFSKTFNQKLPKGFSIRTFTNNNDDDDCLNDDSKYLYININYYYCIY